MHDFWFGVAATLGAEFVLVVVIVAAALLHSEKASNKLLKAARKPTDKKSND